MKKILLALVISFYAHTAWALTIATGPSDGSYFQIAQDIKNVAGKDGIDLQVMATKGSLENLELLGSGKVDLAIVQLDALRFISDVIKQDLGLDLFDKIKVVLNLYPEEIHILTNKKDIQTFYNLEGKRVSVGPPGGGADTETYAVPAAMMGLDKRDEKYVTQVQQLVLTILNNREFLEAKGHPKWKSSIIRTYFPYRGYEPTNQMIQIFNMLDKQGYKVIKK